MGIFDRDSQTQTMDRPRTETASTPATQYPGNAQASRMNQPTGMPPMTTSGARTTSKSVFKVRWTNQEGEVVSEYMQAMSPAGKMMGTLHIAKPEGWPAGHYKLEFMLNDTTAATMDFEVR